MNYKRIALVGVTLTTIVFGSYRIFGSSGNELRAAEATPAVIATPEPDQGYETLIKKVEQGLEKHPEHANRLIRKGIQAVEKTDTAYEPETCVDMFSIVRGKMEKRPEIADFLGPAAKEYLRKQEEQEPSSIEKITEDVKDLVEGAKITGAELYENITRRKQEAEQNGTDQ